MSDAHLHPRNDDLEIVKILEVWDKQETKNRREEDTTPMLWRVTSQKTRTNTLF